MRPRKDSGLALLGNFASFLPISNLIESRDFYGTREINLSSPLLFFLFAKEGTSGGDISWRKDEWRKTGVQEEGKKGWIRSPQGWFVPCRFLNGQLIRRGGIGRGRGSSNGFNRDNFKDEVDFNCDNGEKERDEISLEVKGKVQQVAFLFKTLFFFFFLQASMKDEWNKRLLGTFPCIKIFFLFFLFYQNISYASFRVGGKSGRERRLKQFSAASPPRRTWRLVENQVQVEIGSWIRFNLESPACGKVNARENGWKWQFPRFGHDPPLLKLVSLLLFP